MSYLVKYGNQTIFEAGSETYAIHDAKLSQTSNGVSTFSFTMPPTHPLINSLALRDFDNLIEVYFDDTRLFTGFVSSITVGLYLEAEVACKSEFALLDEILIRYSPSTRTGNTILAELLGMYGNLTTFTNEILEKKVEFAVDPESQANSVGYTSADVLGADAEAKTPKSILAIIMDSMVTPYGAFIRVRKAADGTNLVGVFPSAPDTSTQVVNFGDNLMDYDYTETDEGMYNACLPIGGTVDPRTYSDYPYLSVETAEDYVVGQRSIKIKASSGTAHTQYGCVLVIGGKYGHAHEGGFQGDFGSSGVTIDVTPPIEADIPSGTRVYIHNYNLYQIDNMCAITLSGIGGTYGDYRVDYDLVYHTQSMKTHGMKCFAFQDNNIRNYTALKNKAIAMIAPRLDFKRSLAITALDMAFYANDHTHLQAGQKLRVISEPHNLDTIMYVRTADINLDDPSMTKYVLGTVDRALTRQMREIGTDVRTGSDNFIKELANYIPDSTIEALS